MDSARKVKRLRRVCDHDINSAAYADGVQRTGRPRPTS